MAGPIRDDSAGSYGTWNNDELSWLDYLTAKASDGGNALANLGRNLVDGFSPIGTSEQGNMALQVPPIVSGIAQSYSNLAGTPSHPGNAYDLTGVPELDAPIQQDMSNVLLSLYGGNAVSGLAKPRGALGAGAARDASTAYPKSFRYQDGSFHSTFLHNGTEYKATGRIGDDGTAELSWIGPDTQINPMTGDWDIPPSSNTLGMDVLRKWRDGFLSENPDVKRFSGERISGANPGKTQTVDALFSDTGKPSILGSAMAGAGERNPIDIRRVDEGKNRGVYHALVGDDVAGYADYGVLPNAGVVRGVAVDPAFQRQGVASALHGRIQDDLGLPLTPDNTLSQEGYDFWKASYPEAVRDHRPNGTGYWIDDVNRDMSKGVPAWRMSGGPNRPDDVLWSDNRPSLLGSALATAGENYDLPEWLRF